MKDNVVHLKLEHNEAVEGKRTLLSSEINLLQLLKIIKKYQLLRNQELNKKIEMQKKIKEIRASLELVTRLIPNPDIPKEMQKKDKKDITKKTKTSGEKDLTPLEEELKEIQRKLKELE